MGSAKDNGVSAASLVSILKGSGRDNWDGVKGGIAAAALAVIVSNGPKLDSAVGFKDDGVAGALLVCTPDWSGRGDNAGCVKEGAATAAELVDADPNDLWTDDEAEDDDVAGLGANVPRRYVSVCFVFALSCLGSALKCKLHRHSVIPLGIDVNILYTLARNEPNAVGSTLFMRLGSCARKSSGTSSFVLPKCIL